MANHQTTHITATTGAKRPAARPAPRIQPSAEVDANFTRHPALRLQRSAGNQAVARMIQAKLAVGPPGDVYEQEADRVADRVLAASAFAPPALATARPQPPRPLSAVPDGAIIQRTCAACSAGVKCPRCQQDEERTIRREADSASSAAQPTAPADLVSNLGAGQPLSPPALAFFESRLGGDLSRVRLHTDGAAAEAARSIHAHAFTSGSDIAFGAGQYQPGTLAGTRLLAHELAHVIQQSGTSTPIVQRQASEDLLRSIIFPEAAEAMSYNELAQSIQILRHHLGTGPVDDPGVLENLDTLLAVRRRREERTQQTAKGSSSSFIPSSPTATRAQDAASLPPAAPPAPAALSTPQNPPLRPAPPRRWWAITRSSMRCRFSPPFIRRIGPAGSTRACTLAAGYRSIRHSTTRCGRECAEVLKALDRASRRAETASGRYEEQQKVNAQYWILAPIVKALGNVDDPGPMLENYVQVARFNLSEARAALDAGDFVSAARLVGDGERGAEQAATMVAAYVDQIIGAAEMTVTVLEGVKTASEVVLFLCAVAATGGAAGAGASALGLEGAGGATTLFGFTGSTAMWATWVGAGAAITQEAAVGIARAAEGDKVDWGEIAVHAAIQVIVAKLSPSLGQRLSKELGKAAVATPELRAMIARVGMARVVTVANSLLLHEGSQIFTTAVEDTVWALRGEDITWGQFAQHLIGRLTDPKGLLMATLAGSFGATHPEPSNEPNGPPVATAPPPKKSPSDNADWRDVNRSVGITKPRTTKTAPATPSPGTPTITAEQAFVPTPAEGEAAFAKELTTKPPPVTDAEQAFRPTPAERQAAFENKPVLTGSGTPVQESANASPKGPEFQSASIQKPSAFPRSIRGCRRSPELPGGTEGGRDRAGAAPRVKCQQSRRFHHGGA